MYFFFQIYNDSHDMKGTELIFLNRKYLSNFL